MRFTRYLSGASMLARAINPKAIESPCNHHNECHDLRLEPALAPSQGIIARHVLGTRIKEITNQFPIAASYGVLRKEAETAAEMREDNR